MESNPGPKPKMRDRKRVDLLIDRALLDRLEVAVELVNNHVESVNADLRIRLIEQVEPVSQSAIMRTAVKWLLEAWLSLDDGPSTVTSWLRPSLGYPGHVTPSANFTERAVLYLDRSLWKALDPYVARINRSLEMINKHLKTDRAYHERPVSKSDLIRVALYRFLVEHPHPGDVLRRINDA